jgi:membrane-associated protease RseP (regulator of RpoE activity)
MVFISILFLVLSISLHELGHAYFMKKNLVSIKEIVLLGIGKKILSFNVLRAFGKTPIIIRLFPIGAYVSPTDKGFEFMEALPLGKYGEIMGAGIAINFISASILIAISNYLYGYSVFIPVMALIAFLLILIFLRYTFYILPILGTCVIYILLAPLFTHPKEFVEQQGSIVQATQFVIERSNTWARVFETGGFVSLGIGLFNCIPFQPLDGGKIFSKVLETIFHKRKDKVRRYYLLVTIIPFALLIILSLGNDVIRIFKMIF